jgi:outer membrane immunogenic protein
MKKLLLSSTFLVIGSMAAVAADLRLPVKAPIATAPAFSWTGCYVGAHVGGSQLHSFATTNFEGTGSASDNGTGTIAGGQVGCNYQAGNWVFGVEGEGSWSNSTVTNTMVVTPVVPFDTVSLTTKNTSDFSVAGRAGFAFDRTLIYGKGGWAWGSFDYNSTLNCCFVAPTLTSGSYNLSGFLVGAGVEHALTRNWTVKFEYNYLDFGSKLFNAGASPGLALPANVNASLTQHVFKVGTNYLFDFGGAPLVAKY